MIFLHQTNLRFLEVNGAVLNGNRLRPNNMTFVEKASEGSSSQDLGTSAPRKVQKYRVLDRSKIIGTNCTK